MFTIQSISHRSHVFYDVENLKWPETPIKPGPRVSYKPSPLPEGVQNTEKTENFFKNLNAKDSAWNYMVSDEKVKAFKTDMLAKFPTLGSDISNLKLDNFDRDTFGSNKFGEQMKVFNQQTGVSVTVNGRWEVVEKGNTIFDAMKSQMDEKDFDKIKGLMKNWWTMEGNPTNGSLELKNAQWMVKDGVRIAGASPADIRAWFSMMARSNP